IISYKIAFTNNHILNTLLMKLFEWGFGASEFVLRLPNLLAFILYLGSSFMLIRKGGQKLMIAFFMLLTFNPYLLDFFGLARGYGLSIGFMVGGLYFLLKYFDTYKNSNIVLFNLFAFLAVLSNFTLVYFWVASWLIFNILVLLEFRVFNRNQGKRKLNLFKLNSWNFISLFVAILFLYEPFRRIINFDVIDFGGNSGFIRNTIGMLVIGLFYDNHIPTILLSVLKVLIITFSLSLTLLIFIRIAKKDMSFFKANKPLIVLNFMLIIIAIETIIHHYLFHTGFLMGRFALFLFPLFVLNVVYFAQYLYASGYQKIVTVCLSIMLLFVLANVLININTKSYRDWYYDMGTKKAVQELVNNYELSLEKPSEIKLGVNWLFEPSMNFYRKTWDLNWLLPIDREGLTEEDDYDYVFKTDSEVKNGISGEVIFSSEKAGTILIKRDQK
ncbi:MAG: hypothetical protein J7L04_02560, partial [Bacteroidales bacterium]|nr:hypothetical protein [Bacteroidales bacterium]